MRARRVEADGIAEIAYSVAVPCYVADVRTAMEAIEADWAREYPGKPHRVLVDIVVDKQLNRALIFHARET